jgi:MFS family permease
MRRMARSLWRDADFLRLWTGQSVSALGDRVSSLAIPTAAILLLHADALRVGLLYVCFYLPYPLLALPAGVLVDRVRRRPLLIGCDVGRFAAVVSIPAAAAAGHLTLDQLYAVGLVQGSLSTVFSVAHRSYLPALVGAQGVVDGNSRLQSTEAAAQTAGPGLAGVLIQLLGAVNALLVDAASFAISAAMLRWIRRPEDRPRPTHQANFRAELKEGLGVLWRHPVLRWTAACVATSNFGQMVARTVFLLFAYQVLRLPPVLVGLLLVVQGLAGIAGAAAAASIQHRLGTGLTLGASILGEGLGWALLPLGLILPAAVPAIPAMLLVGFCGPIWEVSNVSLRQSLVPGRLQGRIHASHLAIAFGTIPLGALTGGWLAGALEQAAGYGRGLGLTLAVGGVLGMASAAWIAATPVRRLKSAASAPAWSNL